MRAACAVLTRNFGHRIGSWIAWHLALGFERVLVFDLGSTDGTRELVKAWTEILPVALHTMDQCSGSPIPPRLTVAREAVAASKDCDWLVVLDTDEYLDPGESLATLVENAPHEADAIALNWCIFGSNGHISPAVGPLPLAYDHRAPEDFPDHGFARLLVRPDRLGTITDPMFYTLERQRIHDTTGNPVRWTKDAAPTNWSGGRILHYVCSPGRNAPTLTETLWQHYDRNDVADFLPRRHIASASALERMTQKHLLLRAAAVFAERHATLPPQRPEHDNRIPDTCDRPGLRYHRIFPPEEERNLLAPPCRVATSFPQPCLIHDSTQALLAVTPERTLTRQAHAKDETRSAPDLPLVVAMSYPDGLLILTAADSGPLIVGDIPCVEGHIVIRIHMEPDSSSFTFPRHTGLDTATFSLFPVTLAHPAPPMPIPDMDTADGLSLKGLYLWSSRLKRSAQEVQRTLCLLSPEATAELQRENPELRSFLLQDT